MTGPAGEGRRVLDDASDLVRPGLALHERGEVRVVLVGDRAHPVEDREDPPPRLGDRPPLLLRGERVVHGAEQRLERLEPRDLRRRGQGERQRAGRVEDARAQIRQVGPGGADLVEQGVGGRRAGHLQFPRGGGETPGLAGEPLRQRRETSGEVVDVRGHGWSRF